MRKHGILSGLFLAFLITAPANGKNPPLLPAGITVVDWDQIRAEYERHRHAAFPDDAGLHARNFGQGWLERFDGRGLTVEPDDQTWRWGLELAGVTGNSTADLYLYYSIVCSSNDGCHLFGQGSLVRRKQLGNAEYRYISYLSCGTNNYAATGVG